MNIGDTVQLTVGSIKYIGTISQRKWSAPVITNSGYKEQSIVYFVDWNVLDEDGPKTGPWSSNNLKLVSKGKASPMTNTDFYFQIKEIEKGNKARLTPFMKKFIREIINRDILALRDRDLAVAVARELMVLITSAYGGVNDGPDQKEILWTLGMVEYRHKNDVAFKKRLLNFVDATRQLFVPRRWRKTDKYPFYDRIPNWNGEYTK